ncbi:MAG: OmpA family protein [Bacteroidetes bacterium]|nr:OmpA family protein [Bacteroidota bacterium]
MTFRLLSYSIVLILSFGQFQHASSQSNRENPKQREPLYYLGLYGAYNSTIHTADFRELPGFPNCCQQFTSASGSGFSLGGLHEFDINSYLSLQTRLGYATLGADFSVPQLIGNTPITRNGRDTTTPITVNHFLGSTISTLSIEPTLALRVLERFKSRIGFNFGYLMTANFTQNETIVTPDNATFLGTGKSIRNEGSGDIPNKSALQFSGVMGISYELPIGGGAMVEPDIRYQLPFTNISGVTWKVGALQLGASLKFPIYPAPEIQIVHDTIYRRDTNVVPIVGLQKATLTKIRSLADVSVHREDNIERYTTTIYEEYRKEIPRNSRFELSLTAVGIEKNGVRQPQPTIRIEEIETEESFPLLPYIFFIEGDANLIETDVNRLKSDRTDKFSEDNLPRNTLEIYKDLLNIVGSRLQKNPQAIITLTGTNNTIGGDKTTPNLSRSRAEEVKHYLQSVWNIAPERMNIAAQNLPQNAANNSNEDGQSENRRVEISSSEIDILKPVVLKEIVRTANPPYVEITPKILSDSGVASWNMSIEQNGQILRSYRGIGNPSIQRWDILEIPQPLVETPVVIQLEATDVLGVKKSIDTNLAVKQLTIKKKRVELQNDKRIERFSLIVFDYNSATITKPNQRILEEVKRRILPNSEVTIAGYADRTGEQSYNQELTTRRCTEVQRYLGIADNRVKLLPKGKSELLYDNTTSQGRNYSRTVQVIIETPVQ